MNDLLLSLRRCHFDDDKNKQICGLIRAFDGILYGLQLSSILNCYDSDVGKIGALKITINSGKLSKTVKISDIAHCFNFDDGLNEAIEIMNKPRELRVQNHRPVRIPQSSPPAAAFEQLPPPYIENSLNINVPPSTKIVYDQVNKMLHFDDK